MSASDAPPIFGASARERDRIKKKPAIAAVARIESKTSF
jgi:hypothetical protein